MAKRVKRRTNGELLIHKWWFNMLLVLVFLAIAYGFASWAINTGNLLQYAFAFFFLGWSVNRFVRGLQYGLGR